MPKLYALICCLFSSNYEHINETKQKALGASFPVTGILCFKLTGGYKEREENKAETRKGRAQNRAYRQEDVFQVLEPLFWVPHISYDPDNGSWSSDCEDTTGGRGSDLVSVFSTVSFLS